MTTSYTLLSARLSQLLMFTALFITTHSFSQTYVPVPYYTGFESGSLGTEWTATSSQAGPNIEVIQTGTLTWSTQTALSFAGNYFLGMDFETGGTYNLNQADLHLNMAGESNYRLEFEWTEWNDETEVEDGVFVSDDGGATFVKVLDLPGAAYTDLVYQHFDMSLDSINTVHGLSFTAQYVIRFQQYDNFYFAGGNDGHLYDEINVYSPCATTSSLTIASCSPYTVPSGNQTYATSGIYFDTLVNSVACDSFITIDLTINSVPVTQITALACETYTATWGTTYTTSGVYYDTVPSVNACDSITMLDLTISTTPAMTNTTMQACESYTASWGTTYTNSGVYYDTVLTSSGCDSITMLDLTISNAANTTLTEASCETYTAAWGTTYTSSGTYYDTTQTTLGCDSIITLNLSILTPTNDTISETALDTYTSPSGMVYTASGQYNDTIPNAAGCDSVITINLTVEFTGLNELSGPEITGYPNPVDAQLYVSGIEDWSMVMSTQILDMQGRVIATLTNGQGGYDVSQLAPGKYFLVLNHEQGKSQLQFIKN